MRLLSPQLGCPLFVDPEQPVFEVLVALSGAELAEWRRRGERGSESGGFNSSGLPQFHLRPAGLRGEPLALRVLRPPEECRDHPAAQRTAAGRIDAGGADPQHSRHFISHELRRLFPAGTVFVRVALDVPADAFPADGRRWRLFDVGLHPWGEDRDGGGISEGDRSASGRPSGHAAAWNPHAVVLLKPGAFDDRGPILVQLTDLHVTGRNDRLLADTLAAAPPKTHLTLRKLFNNFNDNLRMAIRAANESARRGEADAVILSGDLLDYVSEEAHLSPDPERTNWAVLRDLLLGRGGRGEGLELPCLTVPGNHDYRPYPPDPGRYGYAQSLRLPPEIDPPCPARSRDPVGFAELGERFLDMFTWVRRRRSPPALFAVFGTLLSAWRKGELDRDDRNRLWMDLIRGIRHDAGSPTLFFVGLAMLWAVLALAAMPAMLLADRGFMGWLIVLSGLLYTMAQLGFHRWIEIRSGGTLNELGHTLLAPLYATPEALRGYRLLFNPHLDYATRIGPLTVLAMDGGYDCASRLLFEEAPDKRDTRMSMEDNIFHHAPETTGLDGHRARAPWTQFEWLDWALSACAGSGATGRGSRSAGAGGRWSHPNVGPQPSADPLHGHSSSRMSSAGSHGGDAARAVAVVVHTPVVNFDPERRHRDPTPTRESERMALGLGGELTLSDAELSVGALDKGAWWLLERLARFNGRRGEAVVTMVLSGHAHQNLCMRLEWTGDRFRLFHTPDDPDPAAPVAFLKREGDPYWLIQTGACGPAASHAPVPPVMRIIPLDLDGRPMGFQLRRPRLETASR